MPLQCLTVADLDTQAGYSRYPIFPGLWRTDTDSDSGREASMLGHMAAPPSGYPDHLARAHLNRALLIFGGDTATFEDRTTVPQVS